MKNVSGDEKLRSMRETLNEFGYVRTPQQMMFHENMINACLPIIYGKDLNANLSRIMEENGWDDIMQELLCVTPRRFGKTWAVAMFVAASLINIPNVEIVIFSMALRASRKMLGLVDKFTAKHELGVRMLCRPHNQEQLTLRGLDNADDERKCHSFPGKSDVCFIIIIRVSPILYTFIISPKQPRLFLVFCFIISFFVWMVILCLISSSIVSGPFCSHKSYIGSFSLRSISSNFSSIHTAPFFV